MLKVTLIAFGAGWALILAIASGLIAHDNKLGYGPLVLLMLSTMTGLAGGIEDEEQRVPLLLLAAAAFGSCLVYALLRFFMLFGLAGH